MRMIYTTLIATLALSGSAFAQGEWESLFNGKDLDGWIVKIAGLPTGEDPGRIFRVEDGALTVSYDAYDQFENRFGHIFYSRPFTNYHFRCQYRFVGEQTPGGPKWAYGNSGIMLSGQHPDTMKVDANFPKSIEFQFLAQDQTGTRPTGSICTPGTYVDVDGETVKKHVIKSNCKALPLGEWVTAEAVVRDGHIQHIINGEVVMNYSNPRYDDGSAVTSGYVSLQAESHPCQFRNIEVRVIE